MEWLYPWFAVNALEPKYATLFEEELKREVAPGHPLYGIPVQAIAKSESNDDMLYRLLDGTGRVAEVHLTWISSPPDRPPWPLTATFSSLEEWAEESMRREHDEFRE
ncbi:MAG TPA: hypothetical protein VFS20_05620 [Longimicrobium sp.]|nr:hypothetical protein [Longimicrobium sp.]